MNTTAAAGQAGVTIPTIRTWARTGVVAAVKLAGRWVIDAASLAHRIAIGTLKIRKATAVTLDLTATYTYTPVGTSAPVTITPAVKRRTSVEGEHLTIVRNITPLLATRIDAITDEGDRLHALTVLADANIVISDQPCPGLAYASTRDEGRLATTYTGTRDLPVAAVLDLAEEIRTTLQAGA